MQEIVLFLQGTPFAKSSYPMTNRGAIQGSSKAEIETAEYKTGKKIPMALYAWYHAAGKVPPYVNNYDADHSLDDFKAAQETAVSLTKAQNLSWQLDGSIIPFSQRIGEQFLFVDLKNANVENPPVFQYPEAELRPNKISLAFTSYIREVWIEWLNVSASYTEFVWSDEANDLRQKFIEAVHQEDLVKDSFTSP